MTQSPQLPIGYWLKHTDEVLTSHVNQVLSDNGFTRFRWQTLNLIYEAGSVSRGDAFATMQTFLSADQFDEILAGFAQQGWMAQQGAGDTGQPFLRLQYASLFFVGLGEEARFKCCSRVAT